MVLGCCGGAPRCGSAVRAGDLRASGQPPMELTKLTAKSTTPSVATCRLVEVWPPIAVSSIQTASLRVKSG